MEEQSGKQDWGEDGINGRIIEIRKKQCVNKDESGIRDE